MPAYLPSPHWQRFEMVRFARANGVPTVPTPLIILFASAASMAATHAPLAWSTGPPLPSSPPGGPSLSRRDALAGVLALGAVPSFLLSPSPPLVVPPAASAAEVESRLARSIYSPLRRNFQYGDWKGTSLTVVSTEDAAALLGSADGTLPMGLWPDPALRRPASAVPRSLIGAPSLRSVAYALRRTARAEGAVGLAAQQCGVDASLVWLDDDGPVSSDYPALGVRARLDRLLKGERFETEINAVVGEGRIPVKSRGGGEKDRGGDGVSDAGGGLFLVNPRIISRSPEMEMRIWTERCLVLPPSFEATVLRDSEVLVEYDTFGGTTERIELRGELARAVQHEMDHDRGILITDHVSLDEMEGGSDGIMALLEGEGHAKRMARAYERAVEVTTPIEYKLLQGRRASAFGDACDDPGHHLQLNDWILPRANAAEGIEASLPTTCDEECLNERRRIIEGRRAMMRQARSSTSRQDVFELSQQRAALYNATYQGAFCPPGIPCL